MSAAARRAQAANDAELGALLAQEDADHAIATRRAAAYRTAPHWPFGPLTSHQHQQRHAQELAMRQGQLASFTGAPL